MNLYHIGGDKHNNELYILDDSVAKNHAQILIKEGKVFLIDLGFGVTWVWESIGGKKVESSKKILHNSKYELSKNSICCLGSFEFSRDHIFEAIQKFDGSSNVLQEPVCITSPKSFKAVNKQKVMIYSLLTVFLLIIVAFAIDQLAIKKRVMEN